MPDAITSNIASSLALPLVEVNQAFVAPDYAYYRRHRNRRSKAARTPIGHDARVKQEPDPLLRTSPTSAIVQEYATTTARRR